MAPELNRGFTSNGRTNNVTIFDLKTLKTIGHVKTGQNPDAILFEPVSAHVITFNGRSKDATVFDAKSGEIVATLPLGGKPEFAVEDGKGKVFVNIEDTNEVVQIDAKTSKVVSRYSLAPCDEPSGLAMDVTHRRLFSVCGNKMMVVSNPDSGKVVATPAIGEGPDAAAFDPDNGIAFSSNGSGSLTLVKEQGGKYEPIATVATEPSARAMAFDSKTHNIYLPSADMGPAPAATAQQPRPRPAAAKDSFHIVVVGK